MRRARSAAWALGLALLAGCGAETGLAGGLRVDDPARFAASSHAALLAAVPIDRHRIAGAVVVDGSLVAKEGSRWGLGLRLGYQYEPRHEFLAVGWELFAEGGGPIRDATFAPAAAYFVGAMAGPVIWLGRRRGAEDQNRGYWFAVPVPHLVPFLRYRHHHDRLDPLDEDQHEISAGLALRWMVTSELL